ncbi:MAG: phage head closure protein [Solibacillus sp.]
MYNEVIYLVTKEKKTNEVGDLITERTLAPRFARLKSIGQAEFYQAQAQGLKPEIKFILSDYLDYENQEEVVHNNFRYKVLRTFRSGNEIEIVCYGGVKAEVAQNGDS